MGWSEALEQKAKRLLDSGVYDFIAGGADDEDALWRNVRAFKEYTLVPRVCANVSTISTKLTLCGTSLESPIIIAPTAPHKLLQEDGELAVIAAAETTNTLMIVSCMASYTLETIIERVKMSCWFQIHIFRDRKITENLVKRAVAAGYKALVVTVDMPKLGNRQRDMRNNFKIPESCLAANLLQEGLFGEMNVLSGLQRQHANTVFDPTVTWEDIDWLSKLSDLPILLKGICHPDDAKIAVQLGVDGIIVSNHGARQLGAAIAPINALSSVIQAVNGAVPVLMDGGIRSGADALIAMALGARAVLTGRPVLWGLAVGGMHAVCGVIKQLNRELLDAMTLCGLSSLKNLYRNENGLVYRRER